MADRKVKKSTGYRSPPTASQFRQGNVPWNKGRKISEDVRVDVSAILDEPITVNISAKILKIDPLVAELQSYVAQALKGKVSAMAEFLKHCERVGLFAPPDNGYQGGVLSPPDDWSDEEFIAKLQELGPPPWPGERDGLIPEDQWEQVYGRFAPPRPGRR